MAVISRIIIAGLLALMGLAISPASARSSVDCRHVTSQIGMTICTNKDLAELHARLEAKYAVLARALWYEHQVAIMRERIAWMGSGLKICEQPSNSQYDPEMNLQLKFCLLDVYRKQIADLERRYPFVATWNRHPYVQLRP